MSVKHARVSAARASGVASALILLLAWRPCAAQTIGGRVLEDGSRMAISGATVSARPLAGGAPRSVLTDSLGAFRLELPDSGRFRLTVTHPSYLTLESDSLSLDRGDALSLELYLGRNVIPLKPLVVTARVDRRLAAFRRRAEGREGFGRYLTRKDIERRPTSRVTELLRSIAGVNIVPVSPCRGCIPQNVAYLRGGPTNQCLPAILIDGMAAPKQDASFPLDGLLVPEMLEGVEVYQDAATVPNDLGIVSSACGVVAFWTRPPDERSKLTWKRFFAVTAIAAGMALLIIR